MDYLSQLRDIKSVIASVLSDIFHQGSNMKYTKLGEEVESQENMSSLVVDMFEGETLKCDIASIHDDSSSCNVSSDLSVSVQSVCERGDDSSSLTAGVCVESSDNTGHSSDIPCKLVITYYFSFDTEDAGSSDYLVNECNEEDVCEDNVISSEQDITFEESSFCCENDADILEYSSVKNGSKNNLLDGSFVTDVCDSIGSVCLVDYDSDPSSSSCSGQQSDSETISGGDLDVCKDDLDISDSNDTDVSVSKYCGNPATPSMRKGFIYYSSEVRLYQGELRYDDTCSSQKKFKLARKLLKKMFPSQKYVVNA